MQTLRITSDITDTEGKFFLSWAGIDGVTFDDVAQFLADVPDGEAIKLLIKSRGGLVDEAWAMYDALRASGREIHSEVIGECSSAATILLLAAPAERRTAHPNAKFLFHFPYVDGICEPLHAEDAQKLADGLGESGERLLDLYVERAGVDREQMRALMQEDKQITADEAKELGFIAEILPPISAQNKQKRMSKVMQAFKAFARAMKEYGMELETADGKTLELVKEQGEPQVGDEVLSDDGEYILSDGRVIVVEGGVIVEIKPVETEETTEVVDEDEPTELESKVAELEATVAELESKVAEILEKLESKEEEETTEETEIVDAVRKMGGLKALKALKSTTKAPQRATKFNTQGGQGFAAYHASKK